MSSQEEIMATLRSDLAGLQERLRAAGIDDSLPSEQTMQTPASPPTEETETELNPAQEEAPGTDIKKAAAAADEEDEEKEERSAESLERVRKAAEAMDMAAVGVLKAEGNECFRKGEYPEANAAYLKAIRMLDQGEMCDAKLLSNMAASQLAIDKFVAAAMYGQRCMEADPQWWKGHWYRGQALMKMLKGKPQSTAMGERCEQAKFAFESCLKTSTLPAAKRPQVEEELQACKGALMQMSGCGQS